MSARHNADCASLYFAQLDEDGKPIDMCNCILAHTPPEPTVT